MKQGLRGIHPLARPTVPTLPAPMAGEAHDALTAAFVEAGGLPWPAAYRRQLPLEHRRGHQRESSAPTPVLIGSAPPGPQTLCTAAKDAPPQPGAVSAAHVYRALSEAAPIDTVILLFPASGLGGSPCQLSGVGSWPSPLGAVAADENIRAALAADGVSLGRKRPEPPGGPEDRLPLAHAPWLYFLAPQYDCERRDGLIAPKVVPIAVDDAAMNDASAQALASAICGVVGTAATYGQRCAVLATLETESLAADRLAGLEGVMDDEEVDMDWPHPSLNGLPGTWAVATALHCAKGSGRLPALHPLFLSAEDPATMSLACSCRLAAAPPRPELRVPVGGSNALYQHTISTGWSLAAHPWEERHNTCGCDDPNASWGGPSQMHIARTRFNSDELHAVWTPASDPKRCTGVVVTVPGAGAGAGPCGAFGPFCLFSRLAQQLPAEDVGVLQLIWPDWSAGKQSVAQNGLRRAAELLAVIQPAAPIVAVGWSMGGAASIEACGRVLNNPTSRSFRAAERAAMPVVAGVITLASQAAGASRQHQVLSPTLSG